MGISVFLASSANFNIHIYGYRTTFNDVGYTTVFKVDENQEVVTNHKLELNKYYLETIISSSSSNAFANIAYKVTNRDTRPHKISIATHADIQIRDCDSASIYNLFGNRGFRMEDTCDSNTYTTFVLRGLGGIDVDTYWFGAYSSRQNNLFSNVDSSSYTGDDSGIAFSWKDRYIDPGQTITFSLISSSYSNPTIYIPSLSIDLSRTNAILTPSGVTMGLDVSIRDQDSNSFKLYYTNEKGNSNQITTVSSKSSLIPVTISSYYFDESQFSIQFYCQDDNNFYSNYVSLNTLISYPRISVSERPKSVIKRIVLQNYDIYYAARILIPHNFDIHTYIDSENNYYNQMLLSKQYNINIQIKSTFPCSLSNGSHVFYYKSNSYPAIGASHNFEFVYSKPMIEANLIKRSYVQNDDVPVQLNVKVSDDDQIFGFKLFYSFNGNPETIYNSDLIIEREQYYEISISLPSNLKKGSNQITLRVEDEDKFSDSVSLDFDYHYISPNIIINNLSKIDYIKYDKDKINISGHIIDANLNKEVTVYYSIDNEINGTLCNISINNKQNNPFICEIDPNKILGFKKHQIILWACNIFDMCSNYSLPQHFNYYQYPQTKANNFPFLRRQIMRGIRRSNE